MRRSLEFIGAWLGMTILAAGAACAGERVVLTTGFEIHAERHEIEGDSVRVFDGNGVTVLPASLIAEYRVEEYTPPVPAAAAPAVEVPATAPAANLTPRQMVEALVAKKKLPKEMVALVNSVMRQESGFRADAVSPKGALGLMQLMPGTAKQLGVDPKDPAQNVEAGTRYLTELLEKYKNDDDQVLLALAAYNAGPGAVDKYHGVPPYKETVNYVRRVAENYLKEQSSGATLK